MNKPLDYWYKVIPDLDIALDFINNIIDRLPPGSEIATVSLVDEVICQNRRCYSDKDFYKLKMLCLDIVSERKDVFMVRGHGVCKKSTRSQMP